MSAGAFFALGFVAGVPVGVALIVAWVLWVCRDDPVDDWAGW